MQRRRRAKLQERGEVVPVEEVGDDSEEKEGSGSNEGRIGQDRNQ